MRWYFGAKVMERHVIRPGGCLPRSVPNLARRRAVKKGPCCVLSIRPSIGTRDDLLQNVADWHPVDVIAIGVQESAEHDHTHIAGHSTHGRQEMDLVAG